MRGKILSTIVITGLVALISVTAAWGSFFDGDRWVVDFEEAGDAAGWTYMDTGWTTELPPEGPCREDFPADPGFEPSPWAVSGTGGNARPGIGFPLDSEIAGSGSIEIGVDDSHFIPFRADADADETGLKIDFRRYHIITGTFRADTPDWSSDDSKLGFG